MAFHRTIVNSFVVCAIGVLCLPILLWFAPNVEMGRAEARAAQAYMEVRDLHSSISATPTSVTEFADRDPWGKPYRVMPIEDGTFRVVSTGPDMSLSQAGADSDDIYSDMPMSPMEPFRARRNRQWLIAFTVTAGAWILLAVLYIRSRRATLM